MNISDILQETGAFITNYYYMFWKLLFALPVGLRNLLELLFAACMVNILAYWAMRGFMAVRQGAVYIWMWFCRHVIMPICLKTTGDVYLERLAAWDDKNVEKANSKINTLQEKRKKIKDYKSFEKKWRKGLYIGTAIIYIWLCLPFLPFIKAMDAAYRPVWHFADSAVRKVEDFITPAIDEYPDVFHLERVSAGKQEEAAIKKDVILILNEKGQNGSFIRSEPSISGEKLGIVMEGDQILYRNDWVEDGERYWMRVTTDHIESGWISGNLIDEKQMNELGFVNKE